MSLGSASPWPGIGAGGGGGGGGGASITGSASTPGAVPTLVTWGAGDREVAALSNEYIEAWVVCRDLTGTERAAFRLECEVYREGGAAAIGPAGVSTAFVDRSDVGISATIVMTGNDIDVQVTGLAATDLVWGVVLSRAQTSAPQLVVEGISYTPTIFPGLRTDSDVVSVAGGGWSELSAVLAGPPAGVTASGVTATGTTRQRRLWFPAQNGGGTALTYGLVQAVAAGAFFKTLKIGVRWPVAGNGTLDAAGLQGQHIVGLIFCQSNGDEARGVVMEMVGSLTTAASQVRARIITGSGAVNNAINGSWTLGAAGNNLTGGQVVSMGLTLYLERTAANTFNAWVSTADGPVCPLDQGFSASAGAGYVGVITQAPPAAAKMADTYLLTQMLDLTPTSYPWETTL